MQAAPTPLGHIAGGSTIIARRQVTVQVLDARDS